MSRLIVIDDSANDLQVTRRIKGDPQLQTIPVLILTGSDSAEHVVQGLGAETLVVEQPSNLLGAMPHMTFEESSVTIGPGDTLFVYTDGLTDRMNASREFYSIDRVAAVLERSGNADLSTIDDAIYADVSSFQATEEFRDDIAFVVTRFQ